MAQKRKSSKTQSCCSSHQRHPDHSEFLPRLNRIEGQLTGIRKMIEERRYCVEILVQFRAVMAALRSVEVSIFERHLQHCLKSALLAQNQNEVDEKIRELTELLVRRTSL